MKLDQFEKGGLRMVLGAVIFLLAVISADMITSEESKNMMYLVAMFGAVVEVVGFIKVCEAEFEIKPRNRRTTIE